MLPAFHLWAFGCSPSHDLQPSTPAKCLQQQGHPELYGLDDAYGFFVTWMATACETCFDLEVLGRRGSCEFAMLMWPSVSTQSPSSLQLCRPAKPCCPGSKCVKGRDTWSALGHRWWRWLRESPKQACSRNRQKSPSKWATKLNQCSCLSCPRIHIRAISHGGLLRRQALRFLNGKVNPVFPPRLGMRSGVPIVG